MFGLYYFIKKQIYRAKHSIFRRHSLPELKNIAVVVWDFDGTLYESGSLVEAYQTAYFNFVRKKLKKPITLKKFLHLSDHHGSWSKAASHLLAIEEAQVNSLVNATVDKVAHIQHDDSVVKLLGKLKKFTHVILTNSHEKEVIAGLQKIGFKKTKYGIGPFAKIFSADSGILKPHQDSFLQVIQYTKLPAKKHLMIGDSQTMDILPAQEAGLHALHVSEALPYLRKYI